MEVKKSMAQNKPRRSSFWWNVAVAAHARSGQHEEVLRMGADMLSSPGVRPNRFALVSILSAAARLGVLAEGRRVHRHLAACGPPLASDPVLNTALLTMYAACGLLGCAHSVFASMPRRSTASWNALIAACARCGRPEDAMALLPRMCREGARPNQITFLCLLGACARSGALAKGRELHDCIVRSGLESDAALQIGLLNMYGKCASPDSAWAIFDRMQRRPVPSWNAMIAAYAAKEDGEAALRLFHQMLQQKEEEEEGVKPDRITFLCLLSSCAAPALLGMGRKIHGFISALQFEDDIAVKTALISMYGKCGSLEDATSVFNGRGARGSAASWNAMIGALVHNGHAKGALELFPQMGSEGVKPDKVTFLCLLSACASLASLEEGKCIHNRIIASGFDSNVAVMTALINVYGKCGRPEDARSVFDGMENRDLISWSAMLTVYTENGLGENALGLFRHIDLEGARFDRATFLCLLNACSRTSSLECGRAIGEWVATSEFNSDVTVKTALLHMHGKCGDLKTAWVIFDEMCSRNVISWNAMVAACVQNGHDKEALRLLQQMELEGVKPNEVTFLCLVNACANSALLGEGREIHRRIASGGFESEVAVQNALINMYGKCGSVHDGRFVFDGMRQRNRISWSAMLAAYAQNGHGEEALKLFERMDLEGVEPHKVTFVCLLNACTALASLENGRAIHRRIISSGFDSEVSLKTGLMNMYAKCGSLEDAQAVFDGMHECSTISCNAMLAAYAQNGHVTEVLKLFQLMGFEGILPDEVTFLCLLSACSHAGFRNRGWQYFVSMNEDCGIMPLRGHYVCIVDLLGRAGCLEEAKATVRNMPVQIGDIAWMTLLSACRIHKDVEQRIHAAESIYWSDDPIKLIDITEELGVKKPVDHNLTNLIEEESWDRFYASHTQMELIYNELEVKLADGRF